MRKVVYNNCFGGFSLSNEAVLKARELSGDSRWGGAYIKGETYEDGSGVCRFGGGSHIYEIERHDPILVKVVEELGSKKASGYCSDLQIKEVHGPYYISDYDGNESVVTDDIHDWR